MGIIEKEIGDSMKGGMNLAYSSGQSAAAAAVIAIIVLTWLHFMALKLVITQLVAHPDNKPLWVGVAICIFCLLLLGLPTDHRPTFALLALASFWCTVAVAWIVKVYYDHILQKQWTREVVVQEALHRPWW